MCIILLGFWGRSFLFSQTCFVETVILYVKPGHRAKVNGGPAHRKNILPSKISKCCYLGMGWSKIFPCQPFTRLEVPPLASFHEGPSRDGYFIWSSFWFLKEETRHLSQHIITIGWMIKYSYLPSCQPRKINQINLGEGEKKGHLAPPWWNLDRFWATDGHLGCWLSGCFGVQYMFVKTLTSPLGFVQIQIGISGDSLIFYWLGLPFFIKTLANIDYKLIS